jgi:hypothetical protein
VEVFHEDWKQNEGWGQMTKQQGGEGSSKSLIPSLLTDRCLLLHSEQTARIEKNSPHVLLEACEPEREWTPFLTSSTKRWLRKIRKRRSTS